MNGTKIRPEGNKTTMNKKDSYKTKKIDKNS
jgi:hypothetical protein